MNFQKNFVMARSWDKKQLLKFSQWSKTQYKKHVLQ